MYSQPIPEKYYKLTQQEIDERILAHKAELGEKLVILGHHYQRDEVIQFADYRGDSFKLSQLAASRSQADYIVFLWRALYGGKCRYFECVASKSFFA